MNTGTISEKARNNSNSTAKITHQSGRVNYSQKPLTIETDTGTFDRQTFYRAISSSKAVSRTAEVVTAILTEAEISPNRRGLILALIGVSKGSAEPFSLTTAQLAEKLYGLGDAKTPEELDRRRSSINRQTRREIQKLTEEQKATGMTLVQIEEGWISGYGTDQQTNLPSKISLPVFPLIQETLNEFKTQKSGDRMREAARITIAANRASLAKIPPKKTRRREPDLVKISRQQCLTWAANYGKALGDKRSAYSELAELFAELAKPGGEDSRVRDLPTEILAESEPVLHSTTKSQEGGTPAAAETCQSQADELPDELRAVEAFASVEGELDQVLVLDDSQPKEAALVSSTKTDFGQFLEELPTVKTRAERDRLSIVGRVRGPVLQIDDCDQATTSLLQQFAFATFETSPKNFQCWLAFKDDDDKEAAASRLIAGLKIILPDTQANKGSGGAIRWPGTKNHKPNRQQADGSYPVVKVGRVQLGRTVTPSELDDAGLLATEAKPPQVGGETQTHATGGVRGYGYYLQKAPPRERDGKPDRSKADMAFVNACFRAGMAKETIQGLLMESSERAKEKGWADVRRTVASGEMYMGGLQ
ncbi:MAG: hypothetical protein KA368_04705 [Acidobacteria bacterium]|nr:hypothetical protein [Acidobacteriota bacterium]